MKIEILAYTKESSSRFKNFRLKKIAGTAARSNKLELSSRQHRVASEINL